MSAPPAPLCVQGIAASRVVISSFLSRHSAAAARDDHALTHDDRMLLEATHHSSALPILIGTFGYPRLYSSRTKSELHCLSPGMVAQRCLSARIHAYHYSSS